MNPQAPNVIPIAGDTQASEVETVYVDASVVAKYLGIAKSTVYALSNERELPHYRVGTRFKFRLAEIDEWMAGHRVA